MDRWVMKKRRCTLILLCSVWGLLMTAAVSWERDCVLLILHTRTTIYSQHTAIVQRLKFLSYIMHWESIPDKSVNCFTLLFHAAVWIFNPIFRWSSAAAAVLNQTLGGCWRFCQHICWISKWTHESCVQWLLWRTRDSTVSHAKCKAKQIADEPTVRHNMWRNDISVMFLMWKWNTTGHVCD